MKEKNTSSLLIRLRHKYRLIIMNNNTLEEKMSFKLSIFNVLMILAIVLFCSFFSFFLLASYTPLNEYLPGKSSAYLHKRLLSLTLTTDSLEKQIKETDLYLANLNTIITGDLLFDNADEVRSKPLKIINPETSFNPSTEDSLLRIMVESEDKISVFERPPSIRSGLEHIVFFKPVDGIITSVFDRKKDHLGVDVVAKERESVKSVLGGVVVISHWTSETGYVIGIQHKNNLISLYKHNSVLFKTSGEHVKAGDVIAVIGNSGEFSSGPHLHFEIWHNGVALNPEEYITF